MFLKDLIKLRVQEAEDDESQGPEENQNLATPAPEPTPAKSVEQKPEAKVLAKAGNFQVELEGDDQVNIVDSKGNSRLRMPLVIWQQLQRGSV